MTKPYSSAFLAPSYDLVSLQGKNYKMSIVESVQHKDYELVIIAQSYSPFIDVDILAKYYNMETVVNATMPKTRQDWKLQVWRPKQPIQSKRPIGE